MGIHEFPNPFFNQNNMRKVIILALLVICQFGWAGGRPEAKMRRIAASKLLGNPADASKLQMLEETSAYHIYGQADRGFVVVSTDDNAKEILGYSTSTFDKDNLPPAFKCWLKAIEGSTIDKHVNASYTVVPNFLTTTWGQRDPYNALCPKINEEDTPTGCIATATAQIMYYYKFPTQGKGTGYYTLGNNKTARFSDVINSVYEWDKMYEDYSTVSLTDEIRKPIATLMKEVGLGTHMNYNVGGSGTSEFDAAGALATNFSYAANQIRVIERNYYTPEEYSSIIYKELAERRPLLAVGADPFSGGHAFVFSGVDENGLVYVNWGWNGDADGYYEITNLHPKDGASTYSLDNAVVSGIVPGTGDPSESVYGSQWVFDEYETEQGEKYDSFKLELWEGFDYMELSIGFIYNISPFSFKGKVYLCFESTDGDQSKNTSYTIFDTTEEEMQPAYGWFGVTRGLWASDVKLKTGKYYVYIASQNENETSPTEARAPGGYFRYLLTYEKGVITVEKYTPTGIQAIHQEKESTSNSWYTIDGQRLNGEPTQRGIYIHDGKKVVK